MCMFIQAQDQLQILIQRCRWQGLKIKIFMLPLLISTWAHPYHTETNKYALEHRCTHRDAYKHLTQTHIHTDTHQKQTHQQRHICNDTQTHQQRHICNDTQTHTDTQIHTDITHTHNTTRQVSDALSCLPRGCCSMLQQTLHILIHKQIYKDKKTYTHTPLGKKVMRYCVCQEGALACCTQIPYIPYTAKLSRGKTFAVVHKTHHSLETFAVHQAHAIIYCTQQMIQGENFHDWLKNCENHESFPPRKFCRIRYSLREHQHKI